MIDFHPNNEFQAEMAQIYKTHYEEQYKKAKPELQKKLDAAKEKPYEADKEVTEWIVMVAKLAEDQWDAHHKQTTPDKK